MQPMVCNRCKMTTLDTYVFNDIITWNNIREEGTVYPDEFDDIVLFVAEKFSNPHSNRDVRHTLGNPKQSHDMARCEACKKGICSRETMLLP
jgi:hypothetical protein